MADDTESTRRGYPYMSVQAWYDIRARLRKGVPRVLDADWVASVLGISEKAARNIVPQLRTMGLMDAQGAPDSDLINDLRDDDTYAQACEKIRETVYPEAIRDAFHADQVDSQPVANWFMRNAQTGEATAKPQARFYLALTKGDLPSADEQQQGPKPRRQSNGGVSRRGTATKTKAATDESGEAGTTEQTPPPIDRSGSGSGSMNPTLHVDLQIHISADAGKDQIDAIFESMARHLYGRASAD